MGPVPIPSLLPLKELRESLWQTIDEVQICIAQRDFETAKQCKFKFPAVRNERTL